MTLQPVTPMFFSVGKVVVLITWKVGRWNMGASSFKAESIDYGNEIVYFNKKLILGIGCIQI